MSEYLELGSSLCDCPMGADLKRSAEVPGSSDTGVPGVARRVPIGILLVPDSFIDGAVGGPAFRLGSRAF